MSLFKKLLGKNTPSQKEANPPKASQVSASQIEKEHSSKDKITRTDHSKNQGNTPRVVARQSPDQSANNVENVKQWVATNSEIKDEDLVKDNMDKIFPRLKRGSVQKMEGAVIKGKMVTGEKEVTVPEELMPAGFDTGPDFYTSLAIDHGQMFTVIFNKHVALSGISKMALLQHACGNFQKVIGPKSQISQTIFPNVYQLQTDGNSEASTFLFPTIWNSIQTKLGLSAINLVVPAQNTVLFWESITDETLQDLVQKVSSEVANYPKGSIVSNYLFSLDGNAFRPIKPVFDIVV